MGELRKARLDTIMFREILISIIVSGRRSWLIRRSAFIAMRIRVLQRIVTDLFSRRMDS